jgi:DNA adenine methylase
MQPFTMQLLKWIGNKQRFAHEIVSYFAPHNRYFEPFIGSGSVLATLAPKRAVGSDNFSPLMQIWQTLCDSPETLKKWYAQRWRKMMCRRDKIQGYESIKASYNDHPNGADLLFLCRSCYGGVVRFRQLDGYMSTPCGVHDPILPSAFGKRVDEWRERTRGTEFMRMHYEEAMELPKKGDLIYCDPPYAHSQTILYGAHSFDLEHLFKVIKRCKDRGVYVVLSIDGTKKSGATTCDLPIPDGLFEREAFVNCGHSMLRRFQMNGKSQKREIVADRLLLTY